MVKSQNESSSNFVQLVEIAAVNEMADTVGEIRPNTCGACGPAPHFIEITDEKNVLVMFAHLTDVAGGADRERETRSVGQRSIRSS